MQRIRWMSIHVRWLPAFAGMTQPNKSFQISHAGEGRPYRYPGRKPVEAEYLRKQQPARPVQEH